LCSAEPQTSLSSFPEIQYADSPAQGSWLLHGFVVWYYMTFVWYFACLPGPGLLLAQDRFDTWTTENGLPVNFLRTLVQTRDGHLWMTTGYGIVQFDGTRFVVFLSTDTSGIASQSRLSLPSKRVLP
jgi:hypothetical protein